MRNILISIVLVCAISFGYAQDKVKIKKYISGTSASPTYYFDRTYTNSQTDTTEWINFTDCDSVQFYVTGNDSMNVFVTPFLGDGIKSNAIGSAVADSVKSTVTGYKMITWGKLLAGSGTELIGTRLRLAFQATGNAASSESAKYSVFVRKFKKK